MTTRIEGQRLDVVLERLRETDAPTTIRELGLFEQVRTNDTGTPPRKKFAEDLLTDFVMPVISDPAIFQDHNLISLLERLRDEVLPQLNENPELVDLASRIIDDEVARHNFIRERRLSGMAS